MTARNPLPLAAGIGNLTLASTVTVSLLLGMVFVLGLAVMLIVDSADPVIGLLKAIITTIVVNSIVFFFGSLHHGYDPRGALSNSLGFFGRY